MPDNQANFNNDQDNQPNHPEPSMDAANTALSEADVLEMLPGFVLGVLEPDEMLAIESYVDSHPVLLDRLAALEATTAQLAYAAPYVPVPSHAKGQLMQRVQADLAAHSLRPSANLLRFPPRPRRTPKPSAVPAVIAVRPPARSWFGPVIRTLVGASVAAALILLAISTVQLRATANQLAAQLATVKTQLVQLQAKAADLQNVNQLLQQQLQNRYTQIAVLTSPQREIVLAGTKDAPDATGAFYIHNNTGVLVLKGLQPLPADQAYQFWFIPAEGSPVPSGVIQVTNAAPNTLTVTIPANGQNFAKLGVTIEPKIGSPAPTGALVLLGSPT